MAASVPQDEAARQAAVSACGTTATLLRAHWVRVATEVAQIRGTDGTHAPRFDVVTTVTVPDVAWSLYSSASASRAHRRKLLVCLRNYGVRSPPTAQRAQAAIAQGRGADFVLYSRQCASNACRGRRTQRLPPRRTVSRPAQWRCEWRRLAFSRPEGSHSGVDSTVWSLLCLHL